MCFMTRVIDSYDDRDVSLLAVDQYFRQVRWSAPVWQEEETILLERIQHGKVERTKICPDARVVEDGQAARDRLIEGYQGLVMYLARQWLPSFHSLEWLDLVQEGNLALLRLIEHYDVQHTRESFTALVSSCIRHAFCRVLRDRDSLLRVPGNLVEAGYKLRRLAGHYTQELGREPRSCELAQVMRVSEQQVGELLQIQAYQRVEPLDTLPLAGAWVCHADTTAA
jgi:RNA polymerase primary sigma factor